MLEWKVKISINEYVKNTHYLAEYKAIKVQTTSCLCLLLTFQKFNGYSLIKRVLHHSRAGNRSPHETFEHLAKTPFSELLLQDNIIRHTKVRDLQLLAFSHKNVATGQITVHSVKTRNVLLQKVVVQNSKDQTNTELKNI